MTVLTRILVVLLFIPSLCFGATREVGSGQTYATIQAAHDAADAGDTINIHAGTYTETVTVSKNNMTIQRNGSDSVVLTGRIVLGTTQGVTIDGIEITGWGNSHGIILGSSGGGGTGLTVRNCTIHREGAYTSSGYAGIYTRRSTNIALHNNTIYNCDIGIEVISGNSTNTTYATGVRIYSNTIHDNATDGMEVHGQYFSIYSNIIYSNMNADWATKHPDGIQLLAATSDGQTDCQNVKIYGNIIYNHTQNIFAESKTSGESSAVQNLYIYNNLLYQESGTVNGVALDDQDLVNINLKYADTAYVYNNTLGRSKATSVRIRNSKDGTILVKNNIFANTLGIGITVEATDDIPANGMDYNLYYTTGNAIVWGANNYASLALFQAAVANQEVNGESGDLKFVSSSDYRIQSDSPAVGAGTDLSATFTTDILGLQRNTWDIGAYRAEQPRFAPWVH